MGDLVGFYSQDYDNKVMLEDFNLKPPNPSIALFMNNQDWFNLVKNNTYFKGEGCCIGLILTSRKYSFKSTCFFWNWIKCSLPFDLLCNENNI